MNTLTKLALGLMGQVVEVMPYTARVLLLTDTTHSIPVQINRNGLRAIAVGSPQRVAMLPGGAEVGAAFDASAAATLRAHQ